MEQKRLLLALFLSTAILLGWSYFFQPQKPSTEADNQQQQSAGEATQNSGQPAEATPQRQEPAAVAAGVASAASEDKAPRRSLTISTPLYKVEMDGRGAVA